MIKTIKKLFNIFNDSIEKLFNKWLPRKEFTRSHLPERKSKEGLI